MDFLKGYDSYRSLRTKYTSKPQQSGGIQPMSLQQQGPGIMKGMQLHQSSPMRQAEKDLEAARRSVVTGVQEEYGAVQGQITSAQDELVSDYEKAKKELGTPQTQLEKAYNKLDQENFIDVWLGTSDNKWQAKYRMDPRDLDKAWRDSLETDADMDLTSGIMGPDGHPVAFINVHGYGKEAFEGMANIKNEYLAALRPGVDEAWGKASTKLGEQFKESDSMLRGHQSDLNEEGMKLGTMAANYQTDIRDELKDTVVGQAYTQRRGERQKGFRVLTGGGGL